MLQCVDFTVLATNDFQSFLSDLRVLDCLAVYSKHWQQWAESV